MPQYVLELRAGYRLRTEPDSLEFEAGDDEEALEKVAEAIGSELTDGKLNEEDFLAFGAEALVKDGTVIFLSPLPRTICH